MPDNLKPLVAKFIDIPPTKPLPDWSLEVIEARYIPQPDSGCWKPLGNLILQTPHQEGR